jgi:hypothetical protein
MLTRTLVAAAAVTLLAACSDGGPTGPTEPSPRDLKPSLTQTAPGTPGTPNCFGQTSAYVAQLHKTDPAAAGFPGIGGIGLLFGSVENLQAFIELYCAGGVPF